MRKFIQHMFSLFVLMTVSGFGLMTHSSAMPASMHMEHSSSQGQHTQSSSSSRCVTLCTTAVTVREEKQNKDVQAENDEPTLPYYLVTKKLVFDDSTLTSIPASQTIKPPPKVPIYILNSVFRI